MQTICFAYGTGNIERNISSFILLYLMVQRLLHQLTGMLKCVVKIVFSANADFAVANRAFSDGEFGADLQLHHRPRRYAGLALSY